MAKLIVLRGNSGSGKTCTARALQEKFGANTMLISHDMVRMQILHVRGREGVERSLPLMISLLQYGRQHSEVTILEGILPAKAYSPLFQAALETFQEEIFAYYYDISFEETLRRHSTKPNREEFGEQEMRKWWQEKDFLPMISETVLREDISLGAVVELIYRDITAKI